MAQRLVITGAGGLVGGTLAEVAAARGAEVVALTSAQWDITDPAAGADVVRSGDVVVNCAAYTAVDAAEDDEDRAHAVNAVGPGNLARTCAREGAQLVHLSTDYVFSGAAGRPYDTDDDTGPLSVYGRTKLAGERAVHAALPAAHVVRTSWVYRGAHGDDFVATMRRQAAADGPVEVVADQIGSPTSVVDLVGGLLQVAGGGIDASVLHAANGGQASRFDLARAVFAQLGADTGRLQPVGSDRHPRPAPRPPFSALSPRRSTAAGLTPLRPWRDALAAALTRSIPSTP